MSEHKIRRPFKKITKRRSEQPPPIHPHIEQIQVEINLLQAELDELEAKEIPDGDDTEKQTVKACLERYQNTLMKLTDSAMKDKLRIYHEDYIERDARHRAENQTLAIQVDNAADKLLAATELSDQLIGSSVYATKDSNPKNRSLRRKSVFEVLRKFESGSEERVTINNDVTFKQLKLLFDDVWNNTIDGQRALEKAKSNDSGWLFIPSHKKENGTARDIESLGNSYSLVNQQISQPKSQNEENVVKQNGNESQKMPADELLNKESNKTDSTTEENIAEAKERGFPKNKDLNEADSFKEQMSTEQDDTKAQLDEFSQNDVQTNDTAEIENPTLKKHNDAPQDEVDQDFEKKSAESDPSADSWRRRSSDQFNGRGARGGATRGFKRGANSGGSVNGRGRFTKPRGTRGAPRGRGRGYGRNESAVTG